MKEIRIKLEIIHREKIGKDVISIIFKELLPNKKKMIKILGKKVAQTHAYRLPEKERQIASNHMKNLLISFLLKEI